MAAEYTRWRKLNDIPLPVGDPHLVIAARQHITQQKHARLSNQANGQLPLPENLEHAFTSGSSSHTPAQRKSEAGCVHRRCAQASTPRTRALVPKRLQQRSHRTRGMISAWPEGQMGHAIALQAAGSSRIAAHVTKRHYCAYQGAHGKAAYLPQREAGDAGTAGRQSGRVLRHQDAYS